MGVDIVICRVGVRVFVLWIVLPAVSVCGDLLCVLMCCAVTLGKLGCCGLVEIGFRFCFIVLEFVGIEVLLFTWFADWIVWVWFGCLLVWLLTGDCCLVVELAVMKLWIVCWMLWNFVDLNWVFILLV